MDRFDELAADLLDGAIDDAGRGELDALIGADPSRIALLVEAYAEHRLIAQASGGSPTGAADVFVDGVMARLHPPGEDKGRPSRRISRRLPQRSLRIGRARRTAPPALALIAAGLLAVVGALAWWASRPAETVSNSGLAVLEACIGEVERERDGRRAAAQWHDELAAGDALVLGAGAAATVRYADGTTLSLPSAGRIVFLADAPGKRLDMQRGELEAEVAKQPSGRPLVISAGSATATVVGTRLALKRGETGTRLQVDEGAVRLDQAGQGSLMVDAGYFAIAAPGVPLAAMAIAAPSAAPAGSPMRIVGFTLIDVASNRPIPAFAPLPPGAVVNLASLPSRKLNMRIDVAGEVAVVDLRCHGGNLPSRREGVPPFALAGDTDGHYYAWTPVPGTYVIDATPEDASGHRGPPRQLTFSVIDRH